MNSPLDVAVLVVAVGVGDGDAHDLALAISDGEGQVVALDPQVDVTADETQACVGSQGPGQEPRLEQDLETVADPQDQTAGLGVPPYRRHHRRVRRDGAAPQIVAVGESAGQDDELTVAQILVLMPQEDRILVEDVLQDVVDVVVAVATGKDDDAAFHDGSPGSSSTV